jgi:transposase
MKPKSWKNAQGVGSASQPEHVETNRASARRLLNAINAGLIQPQGYGYSRFCQLYQRWASTLAPSLRQVHVPGEKMFVDWAGHTVPIRRPGAEMVTEASLFVAVLGASNKTFVEAFPDQQLASWITGHCHAYEFYGGVARVTVPDYVARNIIGGSLWR